VLPEVAGGQIRSEIATVQLTATVAIGARFSAAPAGEHVAPVSTGTTPQQLNLAVNAPYRLVIRWVSGGGSASPARAIRLRSHDGADSELSPGSTIVLLRDGRPGAVLLDAVRRSFDAAGVDPGALPVTVDVIVRADL
jgi:hypothetical protein